MQPRAAARRVEIEIRQRQCAVDKCCWARADGCGDNECNALNDCASERWKP